MQRGEPIQAVVRVIRNKLYRWVVFAGVSLTLTSLVVALTVTAISSGNPKATPQVARHPATPRSPEPVQDATLEVLTLNVAHGRSDGRNQMFQTTKRIRSNLDAVAKLLARVRPDVVALQEAEGPSFWSGRFNHVDYLASNAGFEFSAHGLHVDGAKIAYGTAILSSHTLTDTLSVTFEPTPPTFSKGFVVSAIEWPGRSSLQVDVATAHLDFSRRSVRRKQVEQMIEALKPRQRPLIVMDDFNCDWSRADSALRILVRRLNLVAHRPEANDLATYTPRETRLDWVLISREFQFETYKVLPDVVSDHQAVVARVRLKEAG